MSVSHGSGNAANREVRWFGEIWFGIQTPLWRYSDVCDEVEFLLERREVVVVVVVRVEEGEGCRGWSFCVGRWKSLRSNSGAGSYTHLGLGQIRASMQKTKAAINAFCSFIPAEKESNITNNTNLSLFLATTTYSQWWKLRYN
jgi:hypothetical protein